MKRHNAYEFRVTMIDNKTLLERLAREISFLVHQLKLAWPQVKNDPVGFGIRLVVEGRVRLRRELSASSSLGITAALLVVISAVLVVLLGQSVPKINERLHDDDLAQITMLNFPNAGATPEGQGVGAGSHGRVGFARGQGEGSAPEPKRSTGGGGGGDHNRLPAQTGRPPQPSPIPAPIPTVPPVQKQSLPAAGIDIDSALWQNQPSPVYGDPRSKSSAPSNGPGDDGGIGTAHRARVLARAAVPDLGQVRTAA